MVYFRNGYMPQNYTSEQVSSPCQLDGDWTMEKAFNRLLLVGFFFLAVMGGPPANGALSGCQVP